MQRIYATFAKLLREQERNKVYVTELCKAANIDRSTFYANFEDISAFAKTSLYYLAVRRIVPRPFFYKMIKMHTDAFRVHFTDVCVSLHSVVR